MKYINITLLIITLNSTISNAQKQQTFTVKPGESISEVLSLSDIFRYPQFQQGNVYFKSGSASTSRLNYNQLIGEMQFINPKGDTASIAFEDQLKLIVIGKDTFYFDKGYHELIAGTSEIKLTKKVYYRDLHKKIGGYGQASATGAITNINSLNTNTQTYNLRVNEEIDLIKNSEFYFIDKAGNIFKADRKNFLRLASKKKEAEAYINKNSIHFNNEKELIKLINYLNSLYKTEKN
jgi:hypothetical protein